MPWSRVAAGSSVCRPGAYKTSKCVTGESGQSPILCNRLVAGARTLVYCDAVNVIGRVASPGGGMHGQTNAGASRGTLCVRSIAARSEGFPAARHLEADGDGRRDGRSAYHGAFSPGLRGLSFCVRWRSVTRRLLRKAVASSGWAWFDSCPIRRPPVRAPINMTDQNRASASSVPYRLFDPVR
jgi:hypothetical protein